MVPNIGTITPLPLVKSLPPCESFHPEFFKLRDRNHFLHTLFSARARPTDPRGSLTGAEGAGDGREKKQGLFCFGRDGRENRINEKISVAVLYSDTTSHQQARRHAI